MARKKKVTEEVIVDSATVVETPNIIPAENTDGMIPAAPLDAAEGAGFKSRVRRNTRDSLMHEFARIARYSAKIAKRAERTGVSSMCESANSLAEIAKGIVQQADGLAPDFEFKGAVYAPPNKFQVGDLVLPNDAWMTSNKGVIDFSEVDLPAKIGSIDGHRVKVVFQKDGRPAGFCVMSVSHIVAVEG